MFTNFSRLESQLQESGSCPIQEEDIERIILHILDVGKYKYPNLYLAQAEYSDAGWRLVAYDALN